MVLLASNHLHQVSNSSQGLHLSKKMLKWLQGGKLEELFTTWNEEHAIQVGNFGQLSGCFWFNPNDKATAAAVSNF